ncbi:MAG: hypothetical protein ACKOES_04405, partial [Planctomycetaceae bacterium]
MTRANRYRPLCLSVAVCGLLACGAEARAKDLHWVRPRIGQRGTTVEVVLQGRGLGDPRELVFHKPGIRAVSVEPLPPLDHPRGLAHGEAIEEQARAVLEIAPDCEPGEHPFRLRTATAFSVLGTFHVSPFPVVAETSAANNTIESAQPVAADVTVLGMAGADPDVFKVPAVAG